MRRFAVLAFGFAGSLGGVGCSFDDGVRTSQAVCGDGQVHASEACDDGNTVDDDGCTQRCALARCGDGIVRTGLGVGEEGYEACDDGNDSDEDQCTTACVVAACGDGIVRVDLSEGTVGFERCDDGNEEDADACRNDCTLGLEQYFLGRHGGWRFYRIPAQGTMTDDNVHATCSGVGLVTPCAGGNGCQYNNNICTNV